MSAVGVRSIDRNTALTRVAFEAGDRQWTWREVVMAASLWGDWNALEARSKAGIAAIEQARKQGKAPAHQAIVQAGLDFRYQRDLLAASDLDDWLSGWGLTEQGWLEHIARELVTRITGLGQVETSAPPDDSIVLIDAICSGDLEALAVKLAQRLAATLALEHPLPETLTTATLAEIETNLERWVKNAVTDHAIDRAIISHSLDWTTVTYESVTHSERSAIEEILAAVVEDGSPMAEVAAKANVELVTKTTRIDRLTAPLTQVMVAVTPGEFIGPLKFDDGTFLFAHVLDRVQPQRNDAELRTMAQVELKQHATAAAVRDYITWAKQADYESA